MNSSLPFWRAFPRTTVSQLFGMALIVSQPFVVDAADTATPRTIAINSIWEDMRGTINRVSETSSENKLIHGAHLLFFMHGLAHAPETGLYSRLIEAVTALVPQNELAPNLKKEWQAIVGHARRLDEAGRDAYTSKSFYTKGKVEDADRIRLEKASLDVLKYGKISIDSFTASARVQSNRYSDSLLEEIRANYFEKAKRAGKLLDTVYGDR